MTGFAPKEARWIVLIPSPADAEWRAAIREGAARGGLTVIDAHPDHPAALLEDPSVVVVTPMPSVARDAGQTPTSVLIPDASGAVAATGTLFNLAMPQRLWVASQILAEATALPQLTRMFPPEALKRSTAPLEIMAGLKIEPPKARAPSALDAVQQASADAVSLYVQGAPQIGASALWSPEIFLYDERGSRNSAAVGEVDVTGRPRVLVHGPHISLPPGLWEATCRFSIDQEACTRQFRLDWGTQTECKSHTFVAGSPGVYEIALAFEWMAVAPSEVRVIVMEGAFAGALRFLGATIVLGGFSSA